MAAPHELRDIRVAFFDCGSTLIHTAAPIPDLWRGILRDLRVRYDDRRLEPALAAADRGLIPSIYDYRGRMREFWTRHDGVVLRELGVADPDGRVADAIGTGFRRADVHRLFPEVRGVLAALGERGYRLGVISNNTSDLLWQLEDLGIAAFFDTVTYSQEVRAEKPNHAIFDLALQRAGWAAHEAVHVGDLYEADVVGARAVGITPILLDRDGRSPGSARAPRGRSQAGGSSATTGTKRDCLRIRSLEDLLRMLPKG